MYIYLNLINIIRNIMEKYSANSSFVFLLTLILLMTMYVYQFSNTIASSDRVLYNDDRSVEFPSQDEGYIIYNSKCRLPNLEPFNRDAVPYYEKHAYVACRTKDPLTYVENNGSMVVLYINKTVESLYAISGTYCQLSYVSRITDMQINLTAYINFESGIVLSGNTVIVRCFSKWTEEEVYANVHAAAVLNEHLKTRVSPDRSKPNVLLIGVDSVSRLNFHRTMPKSQKILQQLGFIEYLGYNKIDDNTFPNLMAVLTGSNFTRIVEYCNPYKGNLSNCNIIWKDFQKAGYLTAYAEDETSINTFNYMKDGFSEQPTDFCYLPYMLASESLWTSMLDHRSYCTGPETSTERILNAAKDFFLALRDYAKFGLFWTSSSSHDYLNSPSRMDEVFVNFFSDLHQEGVLNNTVLIFLSDHGLRFGNILLTRTGWLEERLPFLFLSFPQNFIELYPKNYANVQTNAQKLTSPYDLHLTLKAILEIYTNYSNPISSDGCLTCKSLFEKADDARSCEEASIPMHYCACTGYKRYDPKSSLSQSAVNFVVDSLNRKTLNNDLVASTCTILKINQIVSASISESDERWYKNETYLLVVFKTIPETILQATVNVKHDPKDGKSVFKLQGGISRLDFYKFSSQCMDTWSYKIYCYCKFNQLMDMNYFSFWFEV